MTNILLAPVYPQVLLAKSAASIDQLSGGRLTLGVAPGARPDDYVAVGQDFHSRGQHLDDALEVLHRAWSGEPVGPGVREAKAGDGTKSEGAGDRAGRRSGTDGSRY